jgi:hypothetical protein
MTSRTTDVIARKTIGHRTVMNTNHGIYAEVRHAGRNRWIVSTVCNGITDWYRPFTTRRDALAAYDELGEVQSAPRVEAIGGAPARLVAREMLALGIDTLVVPLGGIEYRLSLDYVGPVGLLHAPGAAGGQP